MQQEDGRHKMCRRTAMNMDKSDLFKCSSTPCRPELRLLSMVLHARIVLIGKPTCLRRTENLGVGAWLVQNDCKMMLWYLALVLKIPTNTPTS